MVDRYMLILLVIYCKVCFSDEDECEVYKDRNLCENGRCVNTVGGFKCDCPSGFNQSIDFKCEGTACFKSTAKY